MWSSRFNMNAPPGTLQNKKVAYYLLFRTRVATLLEIAADAKHLGALEDALGLGAGECGRGSGTRSGTFGWRED